MSENFLPLILVSAADLASASKLISEIIDNEVTDTDRALRGGRVWRLVNKYYRADVELCAAAPGAPPPPGLQLLEAHVAHVAPGAAPADDARAGAAAVRLLAVDGARAPDALVRWARRRGYEPVPLAERADDAHDAVGVRRLRDALHAHRWRGLLRLDGCAPAGVVDADELDEDEEEEEEEAAVERAEQFAEALGALAEAGAGACAADDDDERRRRAERLVAAFCRALGADLPRL
ncbi:uncharacterized protein LOC128198441 [Bicyclus anynana]|uniref:Uncharacterized protein LOC128198441 n=1 Tax=Bicyclus anynana TaxID=110368 RepID=A0ABM3LLG7_BICAN|nr:uncharacterized protein LOC128198441 [Bicyclus anynana]